MELRIPTYFSGVVNTTRDAFCDMLTNNELWSDNMIRETLRRTGSEAFDIHDVQNIIKGYLTVLSDTLKEGKTL
jgi:hypothetical protein